MYLGTCYRPKFEYAHIGVTRISRAQRYLNAIGDNTHICLRTIYYCVLRRYFELILYTTAVPRVGVYRGRDPIRIHNGHLCVRTHVGYSSYEELRRPTTIFSADRCDASDLILFSDCHRIMPTTTPVFLGHLLLLPCRFIHALLLPFSFKFLFNVPGCHNQASWRDCMRWPMNASR